MLNRDVVAFDRCISEGGVAIFPADTVYGIACDPSNEQAVRRLFLLKGRDEDKPAAVMFFSLEHLRRDLQSVPVAVWGALKTLFPGPLTAVISVQRGMFPLATREGKLGIRVPRLEGALEPLAASRVSVLQTSANLAGGPDPKQLSEIPREIREAVNLQLDGGTLPGTPSTVVDLTAYERGGWELLREGAVSEERLRELI